MRIHSIKARKQYRLRTVDLFCLAVIYVQSPDMNVDQLNSKVLEKCLKGDDEAWRKLYDTTYPLALYKVRTTYPGIDHQLAEDIALDAMLELSRQLPDVRNIKAFVGRVARNKCIDHIRKKNPAAPNNTEKLLSFIESDDDNRHSGEDRTLLEELFNYIRSLKSPCRELIHKRFVREKSFKVIGSELGFKAVTARVNLGRCLKRLKDELDKKRNDLLYELELYVRAMND